MPIDGGQGKLLARAGEYKVPDMERPGSGRVDAPQAPTPEAPKMPEAPAETPEPVGGRPAEWVQVSDISMGDLVRIDGITKGGSPRTLAGYVVGGPELVPTVRARAVRDMFRVLVADNPDGKGKRNPVWVPQDATAARATGEAADMVDGAPQTGADSDVLTGRISDQVATDGSGHGLFPGSLVTDSHGNEGVVTGANSGSAQVQFGHDRTDDQVAPSTLNVTDGGAGRPTGWTPDGHRVTPGKVVGDRDGNMLGTVEEVDGDTATVATPDGMTPMPITGLRVIGDTADTSGQPPKVTRVETVDRVDEGDVILLRDTPNGQERPYRVTGFEGNDTDPRRSIVAEDVATGETTRIPGSSNDPDAPRTFQRLVGPDGGAPDLGPDGAGDAPEPIQVREPARPVPPVDGPTVDPNLSPEERDAITDRGTAPVDSPEAEEAAARIGQDLPVTPEQAQALAEGLREGADPTTPEGRAAQRAADHLDEAAGQPAADTSQNRPEPGTFGTVGVGDTIAMPDSTDSGTFASYRVVDIAERPGGVRVLTVEDADGNRLERVRAASDPLYQLPEADSPAADPDPEPRNPNTGLDTEAFTAHYADSVARAVVDSAIDGTTTPGSIHQLRQQIAEKVTPEALRSAMRKLRRDAVAVVDGSGITGDDRERLLAQMRRTAMKTRVDAVHAAVRTLDDLEPLDGESPQDTAKRAADLLRLIPEALRNQPSPDGPDSATAPDGANGAAARRVADAVSTHVDDAVGEALAAAADDGALTPQRRAEIVRQLAQRMAGSRQATAQQVADQLPQGQQPGVVAQVMAALLQIARRVVELVAAFLSGLARAVTAAVKGTARMLNRFRKGLARRIRSWPETRRLRRLAAAERALTRPADGLPLADRVTHWVQLLPAPGRFGQVARRVRSYQATSQADLAAGRLPDVEDRVRWTMDRAVDRGPGRIALRHLAALRAAGTDVDDDVAARLTVAAPELGEDPHGAVRHALRYQEQTAARVRDLRAVASGVNAPELEPEIEAAELEARHAQHEADRLHQAYVAALPGVVRDTLAEIRDMGPGGENRLMLSDSSDPDASQALAEVAGFLPRAWLTPRGQAMTAVDGDAGGYDADSGTATVADLGDEGFATAAHALLRHLQRDYPDLLAAQEAFGYARTHAGRPGARRSTIDVLLGRLFGGREDQVVSEEQIAARALAAMFSGDWYKDDDLRAFLLGLLATR